MEEGGWRDGVIEVVNRGEGITIHVISRTTEGNRWVGNTVENEKGGSRHATSQTGDHC